jgi:hypothetical protein
MSEHDEPEAVETEDEVEAHGLKEIAVTGLSAAALIAGAGDAIAATTPGHASATAKQAVHKIDAAQKGAAFKGDTVSKLSTDPTLKRATDPTLKRATDPTLKRATDPTLKRATDPTLKRGGPGAT